MAERSSYLSTFSLVDEFREALRGLDKTYISTAFGYEFWLHYSDEFGDHRHYIVRHGENPVYSVDKYINECDIELFADCLPVADPCSEIELRAIYETDLRCGAMLLSELMPDYDVERIIILYAICNALRAE